MRSLEEVSKLFEYNRWANSRTLETIAALTPEEFSRHLGGSFPSVRETLAHIYSAEWIWLQRWLGGSPSGFPDTQAVSTAGGLAEKLRAVEEERRAFLGGVPRERLGEDLSYVNTKGDRKTYPLGEQFVHVVNHSTYHRGQIATMLRQLGKKPVSTDYIGFLDSASK